MTSYKSYLAWKYIHHINHELPYQFNNIYVKDMGYVYIQQTVSSNLDPK